jgi:peptidoglycan hydrolase-like protein with peptidoglycan-binding domain
MAVVILAGVLVFTRQAAAPTKQGGGDTCTSKQFTLGSSGNCVDDIQTMVNFMETDGLTQCPFTGSSTLSVNGSYDTNTQSQVKVVQSWLNCYNQQEGEAGTSSVNGVVGTSTWSGLCTYAFQYPSQANQSTSPYLKLSIAAGKNAGC